MSGLLGRIKECDSTKENMSNESTISLFKTYTVIYLVIGAAICEVLFVFYSYPNDDMVMATFDCLILHARLNDSAQY